MIRDGVELHNVIALSGDGPARRLDRVPGAVREELDENAREMYTWPAGCEVRFVSSGPASVTLSCSEGECKAIPYYGSFMSVPDEHVTLGPEPTTIELDVPDQLDELRTEIVEAHPFAPGVGRIVLQGQPVCLHGVEGDVRPPSTEELPDTRYLAYGTSITQGLVASGPQTTYAGRTARRLGADLINLGTSGSAYCEPAIADYIAGREDWDVATLSISVNMLASGFTAEEFRERASYMIETVTDAHPDKPIACITLYPVFPELKADVDIPGDWVATPKEYRSALRSVVENMACDNVSLLEGPNLLSDVANLAPDLVHPTDHGMIEIAERLAAHLNG